MPLFDKGIDGRFTWLGGSGTAENPNHVTARITRWAVGRRKVLVDISAFEDDGETFYGEGKRAYSVSAVGHSRGTSNILGTGGTVAIALGYVGGTARYQGPVFIQDSNHQSDYKGGDSVIQFTAFFQGDPTSPNP